jgi:hypothetical protein
MLKVKGTPDAWDTAGPAKRKAAEERLVREGFGVVSSMLSCIGAIMRPFCLHRIKRRGSTGAEVGISSWILIIGAVRPRVATGPRPLPLLDDKHAKGVSSSPWWFYRNGKLCSCFLIGAE